MVAIGGIPGSGKTTLSRIVTTELNKRHAASSSADPSHPPTPVAAFVPMDGYHLTRAQLSAMPDPATAHARRGAEFTFDGAAFLQLVQALRAPLPVPAPTAQEGGSDDDYGDAAVVTAYGRRFPPGTVLAPSFDHAVKDPRPDDIAVLPAQRIVVFEGNYVALGREPWASAAALMDEVWFVEVEVGVARRRLAARHVAAGIAANLVAGDRRAVENDLPNGEEIVAGRLPVDEVVVSRDDGAWLSQ